MTASALAAQLPVGTAVGFVVLGGAGLLVREAVCEGCRDGLTVAVPGPVACADPVDGVGAAVAALGALARLDAAPCAAADDEGDAPTTTVLVAVIVALLVAVHDASISSEIPIAVRRMMQRSPISARRWIRLDPLDRGP